MDKIKIYFFLVVILASFLRLWDLGNMPNGITNDESAIIYSSFSIWKTGYDVRGNFLPMSFNIDNSFSPVYIYLSAPFTGILGISPFSGRLLFSLLGIGSVILLFFITRELFGDKKIALLSMFAMAIFPWHVHISRGAWDAVIALFFILLFLLFLLKHVKNGNIIWSLPVFFIAFYSYHATKIFLLIIPVLLIWIYRDQLFIKRKKEISIFFFGIFIILISFFLITKTQNVTRSSVLFFNNPKPAAEMIDLERKQSIAPFIIRQIFNNKLTYYLRVARENYLEIFSPHFLFLYGETSGLGGTYGIYFRGMMYIIELPLLLLGIVFLFRYQNKKIPKIILISLLIAPLPSALSIDKSYVMRSVMMIPFLCIIVGCGIYYYFQLLKQYSKSIRILGSMFLIFIYIFLVLSYLYQYYFRYSVYGAEYWFKSSRDVAEYIEENKKLYDDVYIVTPSSMLMLQYGLFNKVDPLIMQKVWNQKWPKKIDNVSFINGCIDTHNQTFKAENFFKKKTLYIVPDGCHKETSSLQEIRDFGEPLRTIWKIYETKNTE